MASWQRACTIATANGQAAQATARQKNAPTQRIFTVGLYGPPVPLEHLHDLPK